MPHGIIVFGASGSGTTTLGRELARMLNFTHFDADDFFWAESYIPFSMKRPREDRISRLLAAIESCRAFVLSGSICRWDKPFLPLFDLAIFMTAPADVRIKRLKQRESAHFGERILPGGDMHENHREFIDWASAYDTAGTGQRSHALHEEWLLSLSCPVIRIDGANDCKETAEQIAAAQYAKTGEASACLLRRLES
jgi:adenylate kinase family enzyme